MFEAGLEYIRADFHLHTVKDKEFTYSGAQNGFVKEYVKAMKQANIGIGVITNHNKFDKDEYKAICKAARKEEIFVLPGVELTVKEGANGIHTLIVFNPDEWLSEGNNHIQTFLTSAFATISNPENRNTKCIFDLKNTLEKLEAYNRDYFVVFAHVDQGSGLFCECKGGLLTSLAGIAPLKKRVLGLQKSRTYDNTKQYEKCFGYLPALIEGSDPKSISEIGKGDKQTYIKLGEYSYDAIKFALQDYKNRISEDIPKNQHGYIESLEFQGGKFDGQKVIFSPELNTLIGIRGSGKSSVLEAIRYAFDIPVQADKEYKESLIKNILGSGGKVMLSVVDKYGKKYKISRILGNRINILDEEENDLNITPMSLFDGIQYFGQKDLASSSEHENGLLEKLVSGKIGHDSTVDECTETIITAVEQLLDANKIPDQISETSIKKEEIEHKMSIFKEKGVAEKLEKQSGYTKDKAKFDSIMSKLNTVHNTLYLVYEKNPTVSAELQEFSSEHNDDLLSKIKALLAEIDAQLMQVGKNLQGIKTNCGKMSNIVDELSIRMDGLSDEFAEIKREIKDDSLDVDGFMKMTADLENVKEKLKHLNEKSLSKSKIETVFIKAARQRNEAMLDIFKAYKNEIEHINQSQAELEIKIIFKGDREGFKAQMKNDFRGTGISDNKYQAMEKQFIDYVDLVEDWILDNGRELKKIVSLAEYTKLIEKLETQYKDLLKAQVENKVDIYYHDKLLRQHSIGQRASALILFILTQDDNDIIFIDQPEDDLDNKVIYDEVITAISKKKSDIQFLFATHNANIPVLGDADRVLVAEFQDTKIDISQGNIDLDTTHKQIVDIMEGGKEAFEKRQLVYTSWK